MENKPNISDAEWEVMKVLWDKSPATANEVIEQLSHEQPWKPKTIRTLIGRLSKKKIIDYKKNGKEYSYYPLLSEQDCIRAENRSFINKVYGGAVKPMLAAFIEEHNLTPNDLDELRSILDKKEKQ